MASGTCCFNAADETLTGQGRPKTGTTVPHIGFRDAHCRTHGPCRPSDAGQRGRRVTVFAGTLPAGHRPPSAHCPNRLAGTVSAGARRLGHRPRSPRTRSPHADRALADPGPGRAVAKHPRTDCGPLPSGQSRSSGPGGLPDRGAALPGRGSRTVSGPGQCTAGPTDRPATARARRRRAQPGLVGLAAGLELRGLATSQNHHQSGPALDSAEALRGLRLDLAALRLLASLPGDRHRPGILRQIARGSTALEQQVSRLEDEVRQGPDSLRPAREEFDLFALLRRSLEPLRGGGAAPLLYASVDPRLPRRWRGDARRLEELLGELVGRCLAQPFAATVALAVGDGGVLAGHPALLWRLEIDTLAGARILTPELRRRIDRLGGQCGLRGSGGRGIWLRLPLQPAPIQPLEPAPAVPWRQRVLLVHAHRGYRQALARILRHQNCLVDEAPDGATALALLTASRAGHHRYEWLLIQPADGPAEARALPLDMLPRWPRSALNLVVLSSSEGGIHPPRPLLCNDVPALHSSG